MRDLRLVRLSFLTAVFALVGAGCASTTSVPHTATTLQTKTSSVIVSRNQGFGVLPRLTPASHTGTVTIAATLPALPVSVTVLRLQSGTPNDTELRNLTNSLGISDAFIGNIPTINELTMNWKDDRGFTWSYIGSSHTLEGKDKTAPTQPVTLTTLPPTDALIEAASTFLTTHGFDPAGLRQPVLSPDWGTWWQKSQQSGLCVDRAALSSIRFLAASAPTLIPQPPALPKAAGTTCVAPEFPARVRVVYPALVDDRDVVQLDGTPVNGAEVVVDASRMSVISVRLTPYTNPDRSEYPSQSAAAVQQLLNAGGITGVSGNVTITSFSIALLQYTDQQTDTHPIYLIPTVVAHGTRANSDGTADPVTLLAPLLSLSS